MLERLPLWMGGSESTQPPPPMPEEQEKPIPAPPSAEQLAEFIGDLEATKKIDLAEYDRTVTALQGIARGESSSDFAGLTMEDAQRVLDALDALAAGASETIQ